MNLHTIRAETPGVKGHIHLNNAGSSLPPQPVVERIIKHLRLEEEWGGYEAADMVEEEASDFYHQAARFINAHSPREIAFTESATQAWQRIFYSIPLTKHDRVILFQNEYVSLYVALLQRQQHTGCTIDIIPSDAEGNIDLERLKNKMGPDVKMVLLGHSPTQSGQLSPAEAVGEIVKDYPAIYILDATQTIGQYPVDVQKIDCDALCATGRKFLRAPRGTGFLYVKEELASRLEPSMIDLQGADWLSPSQYQLAPGCQRFETWEHSVSLKLGIKEALVYAQAVGIEHIWHRGQSLATKMRQGLQTIKGIKLRDPGTALGNIVTFTKEGVSCPHVVASLARHKISINISKRSYALLDFEQRNLHEVCRASPHYYNSEEEIDRFIDSIRAM